MPTVSVIAGPNGSGKSTLTNLLTQLGVDFGRYLNADDIARDLGATTLENSLRAQEIVREQREAALQAGQSHTFETVMSHPSHIEYMHRASQHGFEVRLYFVATEDPVLNLDRVANRVRHGGHDVPPDRIVARYHRCLANLPAAIAAADTSVVFDNSSVDRPMFEIAEFRKGQAFDTSHISWLIAQNILDTSDVPVWWLEIVPSIEDFLHSQPGWSA